jgi:Fic/DOC family
MDRFSVCYTTKTMRDSIVRLPDWHDLSAETRGRIVKTEAFILDVTKSTDVGLFEPRAWAHRLMALPRANIVRLEHALSPMATAKGVVPSGYLANRTLSEARAFRRLIDSGLHNKAQLDIRVALPEAFSEMPLTLRGETDIYLRRDGAGWQTLLPNGPNVTARILKLNRMVYGAGDQHNLFVATKVLVGFLNCHPFMDGNGRCARVLFSFILSKYLPNNNIYLPLYEAIMRSSGGFLIRLRQAVRRDAWDAIMLYFCDCVDIAFMHACTE